MKLRSTLAALGLGVIAACVTLSANADADPKRGEVLAYTCHGCHGVPGYKNAYPTYSVPKLGGQNAEYIISALNAYAAGERPHQTMHAQAATLSEQDREIGRASCRERVERSVVAGSTKKARRRG